jgi:hypothetical protein
MAENPFATVYPTQADNMAKSSDLIAKQREQAQAQQDRAKNAPIEDLARQVKKQQLTQELEAAPKLAQFLQQQGPTPTPQGPVGPEGQKPTVDPQQQYQARMDYLNNIWSQATKEGSPLLNNPMALEGLSKIMKQGMDFTKEAHSAAAAPAIGKPPMPVGIVGGEYVPLSKAPAGTKEVGTIEYDDKGQPKFVYPIKEPATPRTESELTFQDWKSNNPTTKDKKTGKIRESNRADWELAKKQETADIKAEADRQKKLEAEKEMQPVIDQAVMNEQFNAAKELAYKDKSMFTKMMAKEYKNIVPDKLLANATLTTDVRTNIRKNMAVGLKGRLDNLLNKLKTMKPGKFKTANDFTNWVKNQANDPEMADLLSSKNSILFELGQALGAGGAASDYKTRIDDITLHLGNNVGSMEKTITNFQGALDVVTKLQNQQDPRRDKRKDSKGRPIDPAHMENLLDWELENYLHGD